MSDYYNEALSELLGKTLTRVTRNGNESIDFEATTGERWQMYHSQDCCESCSIEDVTDATNPKVQNGYTDESSTWTFYKLATVKGYVTIRWYGSSNGYYSETASFQRVSP